MTKTEVHPEDIEKIEKYLKQIDYNQTFDRSKNLIKEYYKSQNIQNHPEEMDTHQNSNDNSKASGETEYIDLHKKLR